MSKKDVMEAQKSLVRKRGPEPWPWRKEDLKRARREGTAAGKGQPCDRCQKKRRLYPCDETPGFTCPRPSGVSFLCLPCSTTLLVKCVETSKKLSEEREKILSATRNRNRNGAAKQARPSLCPEGNVPLMMRLIKEGKTKKEIRREFRKLYHALGRTDEKFIRSRCILYRGRALVRLEKEGWKRP